MKLHNFVILFGTGVIIIAFFVALAFLKKDKPVYFKYILTFIILGLLISLNSVVYFYLFWYAINLTILIEQLLLLLQSLMLCLFFVEVLKNVTIVKKIRLLIYLSILIQAILIILLFSKNIKIKIRPLISSNLILAIFCIFYLRNLMKNTPAISITKSTTFWIVMGILYSSCIGFPVNFLVMLIPVDQQYLDLHYQIFSISNMSLIVLYLLIIKSYLCLKHPQTL